MRPSPPSHRGVREASAAHERLDDFELALGHSIPRWQETGVLPLGDASVDIAMNAYVAKERREAKVLPAALAIVKGAKLAKVASTTAGEEDGLLECRLRGRRERLLDCGRW